MVWEASQQGVPFLGVPGNSLKDVKKKTGKPHEMLHSLLTYLAYNQAKKMEKRCCRKSEHFLRILFPAHIWMFPKIVVSQNGWFIMENPIKMDDLSTTILFP